MSRTIAPLATALLALAIPGAALAETQLERMERLSVQINEMTYAGLVTQMPQLAGNMPPATWDAAMREAYVCLLDEVEDEIGSDGVDEMLDNMETAMVGVTANDVLSGAFSPAVPEGLTDAQLQSFTNSCGVVEALMMRMAASGAMSIMMEAN